MSNNSYRIRTNVGQDSVVKVNMKQDVNFLEILSLKINQENLYKLQTSNYGVIVGRVLANDAFGIPNAKVSVFIELQDEDLDDSKITSIYPYKTIRSTDNNNIRYNLLPDIGKDNCYRVVGTFPNKRLILDDDAELEIYDKYWKYTTVTNESGDYMIFGVPTGNQEIHVDIDLSDVGILSQKPRDFVYKGYNITQFDNAKQFKESTNLDNLTQLLSQNTSTYVYPFWGDSNENEIAITRCDVQVQYKFEPTCIFLGSVITDSSSNNIGHKCNPDREVGVNKNLVGMEGVIEMIRKTPDNMVEEFQIQGNRLIDGDGVWCYQIPMNLDYIGTDEFGKIVPVESPSKGIPTRACVRFRFSLQETSNEGVGRHRARYLVPNNPKILTDNVNVVLNPKIASGKKFNQCFDFGSATQDEYFRDLYWNKVYSVKNYIPRLQLSNLPRARNYSALKSTNLSEDKNPIPFNNIRLRLSFVYSLICTIVTILINAIGLCNKVISGLDNFHIARWYPFKFSCINFNVYVNEDSDENIEYYPKCHGAALKKFTKCEKSGCKKESDSEKLKDEVQQTLAQEYDVVNLDFYNDWLNGALYFPLWFWKKTPKRKFLFGLITIKSKNDYCSCEKKYSKLKLVQGCATNFTSNYFLNEKDDEKKMSQKFSKNNIKYGIVKEVENKDGLKIYYYMPGTPIQEYYQDIDSEVDYRRLYATDIILLGSLNDCDVDNLPQLFNNLPSTTANKPFIAMIEDNVTLNQNEEDEEDNNEVSVILTSGMDWSYTGKNDSPQYSKGLFFDLSCTSYVTKIKSCVNARRLSELGVVLDGFYEYPVAKNGGNIDYEYLFADGMVTRFEINDNDSRAMFASMNHLGLDKKAFSEVTKYDTYKLRYTYPVDFDGHLDGIADEYTQKSVIKTYDTRNDDYVRFRFGENNTQNISYVFNGSTDFSSAAPGCSP